MVEISKAAMLDIGLLQSLCQVPADLELRQEDLLAMYRGKLAEQFVAQELIASRGRMSSERQNRTLSHPRERPVVSPAFGVYYSVSVEAFPGTTIPTPTAIPAIVLANDKGGNS